MTTEDKKLTRAEWESLGKRMKQFYTDCFEIKKMVKDCFGENQYFSVMTQIDDQLTDLRTEMEEQMVGELPDFTEKDCNIFFYDMSADEELME